MLKAVKENIVLSVEESRSKAMQAQGYDIIRVDPDGTETLIMYGAGKTVPYGEYVKAVAEAQRATAELNAYKKLFERTAPKEATRRKATAKK